jgi:hypothetical protein
VRWSPAGRAATCWPAAGRADRRGSPGDGATGHDPGPRPAWRPARPSARPCLPAVAAPVQRTPGRRPLPVAVDSHRLRQCRRRTPADQPSRHRPSGHRPSGHRRRFREQQRTAKASAVSGSAAAQIPAAVSGWGRTAADPQPPLRRDGRTAQVGFACLRWSSGQVDAASRERLSGCVGTGRGLPNTGSPHARHCGHRRPPQGMGTLRQRPRWTAGTRTVHHPAAMSDRNGTQCAAPPARPADRQIRSLGAARNLASSRKGSAG